MLKYNKQHGFTLIELLIFIVVIGIMMSLLIPLILVLKSSHQISEHTYAANLARTRMEIILNTKTTSGFSNIHDPCSANSQPSFCLVPNGYNITTDIKTVIWQNDPLNFKKVTVTVTGKGSITLQSLVANY